MALANQVTHPIKSYLKDKRSDTLPRIVDMILDRENSMFKQL